jgi:hypothetical protein
MGRGRPRKKVDADTVRQLAAFGCSVRQIAEHLGVCHDILDRRYTKELAEGRSNGQVRALGRVYQKGVVNGETRSLELYLVNQCGWKLRPEVTVNVLQTGGLPPEEVRSNLLALREAVRSEALREAVTRIEVEVVPGTVPTDGMNNGNGQGSPRLPV